MKTLVEKRVNRLFNCNEGRAIIIPIDHGFYRGNVKGLEDPYRLMESLIQQGVDATLMSFGMGKMTNDLFAVKNAPARILTIDYPLFSNVPGESHGVLNYSMCSSVEQALKWGFDCVKVLLVWGLKPELQMKEIQCIGSLVAECDKVGMPVMMEPVFHGECIPPEKKSDPQLIAHAARMALELGADVLKMPYTGDVNSFKTITNALHVPIVILGGPKMNSIADVFRVAKESVAAGGRGVVFGRNVWGDQSIMVKMVRGLKDAVYNLDDPQTIVAKYGLS
jgi:class I fructose-bisphosphate aldolase